MGILTHQLGFQSYGSTMPVSDAAIAIIGESIRPAATSADTLASSLSSACG